jgi:hypothetical protein
MKINDLRIGNWVKVNDPIFGVNTYKVATIRDNGIITLSDNISCSIDNIEPIELTEEVLTKIGFKKERQLISTRFYLDYEIDVDNIISVKYVVYSNSLPLLKITTSQIENYECFEFIKRGIKYLHELQNTYFNLSGEELNIEL